MDASGFDGLTRALVASSSRRATVGALVAALGLSRAFSDHLEAEAAKRKYLRRNYYGCMGFGQKCRGKDGKCCSGICQGRRPKKSKRDKSRCLGHDAATCLPGQMHSSCSGTTVPCTTSTGEAGFCATTTGNAAYCVADAHCWYCTRDTDCQPYCGPQAACFRCTGVCGESGSTACGGPGSCIGFPPPIPGELFPL